jgi:hypothetical protein
MSPRPEAQPSPSHVDSADEVGTSDPITRHDRMENRIVNEIGELRLAQLGMLIRGLRLYIDHGANLRRRACQLKRGILNALDTIAHA